ncbi:MAG: adenosylmethionine--8-amino-7-oxononanoate transaminase [Chthoniobacterales bacterium]
MPTPSEVIALDKAHGWHPFTPMAQWCDPAHEPLVIVSGDGPYLFDSNGNRYLDGNSSIWTNIHGHRHPKINAAIAAQLEKIAHVSFLGFTHPLAAELGARLCGFFPDNTLTRCFFSDDGSTAMEVALKMSAQFWEMTGQPQRTRFVSFRSAYHGDTRGAASLGDIPLFRGGLGAQDFPAARVSSLEELSRIEANDVAGIVIEPIIQGVAGMKPWPVGMLAELRKWTESNGTHLILDEVMTGFGRTGKMFACQHEDVIPDFLCLAKGLTGGYLPMAATLTNETIFRAFQGDVSRTFFYGHSYTANPLGCAAAMASLDVFEEEKTLENLQPKIAFLGEKLAELGRNHAVSFRQCGFVAGIDVPPGTGAKVCLASRAHGLLTRPIRDTVVLMLPLCVSLAQIAESVAALDSALHEAESR